MAVLPLLLPSLIKMFKFLKNNAILVIILIISFSTYIYKIDKLPPGLTWDEAALGYNAFSILKTAHDEHGVFLPLIFKSFGDYKPGLYIYATIPFVFFLGLSELSVRLASVFSGIFALIGIYLLTNILFEFSFRIKKTIFTPGHFAAFVLAFMPWHLHYSRGAWEANLSVTLTLFSLYFWVKFLKEKASFYPSLLLSLLTLLTYQSAKMLTPLLFLSTLIFLFPKEPVKKITAILSNRKDLAISSLIILLTLLFYVYTFTSSTSNRLTRLSIFNFHPQITEEQISLSFDNQMLSQFFYSEKLTLIRSISSRYFYHLSPQVLFYKGAVELVRESLPVTGLLHETDFIWIFLGTIFLLKQKKQHAFWVIISWLLISPIPSSLTLGEYSATRSLFLTIPFAILIGFGIYSLFKERKKITLLLFFLYIFYIIFSTQTYFQKGPRYLSQGFNYGYKQAVSIIKEHPAKEVLLTDVLGQPYIYYLFYTNYDPKEYQNHNDYIDQGIDVGRVGRVGNISFQQFASSEIETRKNALFIGSIGNIDNSYNLTQDHIEYYTSINGLDGLPIFRVIKTK
jgi:hypothetical protein